MVIRLTNEQALAQLAAVRERERLEDLERTRQATPWNRPPHRSVAFAVAPTITLFRPPPPVRAYDPIAGPRPTRSEDHVPMQFRLLGEGGLLHHFALSAVAERVRREPWESTRAAFIYFVRGPASEGCLNMGIRRPDRPETLDVGLSSCDIATWRFIGARVNEIVRGEPGPW